MERSCCEVAVGGTPASVRRRPVVVPSTKRHSHHYAFGCSESAGGNSPVCFGGNNL